VRTEKERDGQAIYVGWPDIAATCGVSVHVAKKMARKYRMPYVRLSGKATISRPALIAWIDEMARAVNRGKEGKDEFVVQKLKNLRRKKKEGGEREERA